MGNMKTPQELADQGYLLLDTNESTNMTGIIIPINLKDDPMTGMVRILCDTREDLDLIKIMLEDVPQATPGGSYQLRIEVYESSEDILHHIRGSWAIEALLAIVGLMDQEDVEVEWD